MTKVNNTEINARNINYLGDSLSSPKYVEDDIDALTRLSSQLKAMMVAITGEGFEYFNLLNEKLKEDYLWACADKAREIDEVAGRMSVDWGCENKASN